MTAQTPNPANVQGLILRGYTHRFSCHLLFTFTAKKTNPGIKFFFKQLFPKVQSASSWGNNKPVSMLNIGITFGGMQKLGILNDNELELFPPEFRNGPWAGGSQASLGDWYDDKSKPSNWWNKNFVNKDLDCVIHTYGLTKEALDTLVDFVATTAASNGLNELLPLAKTQSGGRLYQSIVHNDPDKIHFGYTDGISEPLLDNYGTLGQANNGDVNSFVIGYPLGSLSQAGPTGTGNAAAFAHDGCYNAFRILYQDVALFNNFLKEQAQTFANDLAFLKLDEAGLEEWFAAKLCGRWRNGSPLMLSPEKAEAATASAESFGFVEQDDTSANHDLTSALKCPFSAHTRVANPRNQALDEDMEGTTGSPRIVRRGMPYGPTLTSGNDDGVDRGLIGMFLCGSLSGQFEKLYGWMNNNNFSDPPVFSLQNPPQDALLANRKVPNIVNSFIIPLANGKSITVPTLPQFLQTRGTAYCLLPSITALKNIAGIID